MTTDLHRLMMGRALTLATQASRWEGGADGGKRADIPVGAVIYRANGEVLAQEHNRVYRDGDPTAHAEILAIRAACRITGASRLDGCWMAVTLEPCTMCAAAIGFARLSHVYFGASDVKQGAIDNGVGWFRHPSCVHRCETIGGLMEEECRILVQEFFRQRRN